jgi:hypothetical protein
MLVTLHSSFVRSCLSIPGKMTTTRADVRRLAYRLQEPLAPLATGKLPGLAELLAPVAQGTHRAGNL